MTATVIGAIAALVVAVLGTRPARLRLPAAAAPTTWSRALLREGAIATLERARPSWRAARRDEQLPDALARLASALRAGQAIGPALIELAAEVPEPLGTELRRLARSVRHGAPLADALAGWAAAPSASADVHLAAAALTLGSQAGGEVARAVDGIAATLRERRELQGEARALATQARASAGVLALAPLAFAGLVATIEPAAVGFLLTTPVGLGCLVLGGGLEAAGAWWMARITRSAA